ncbi:RNA_pol_Rpb2_6 domain-containing protein [Trichonephila inaurata madagascariensis]|uniref:RNA_pol_Rpb2_6 domain-containing protein n=1 Tax=Trichonephila inaurata madagascariensis TaxID=2747483 RepID=A0A8X7CHP1_9ARAC|nr:RNA_pol_Rpb2_6 domain-containing protein [Trichonephila inaurata madagascariensis]
MLFWAQTLLQLNTMEVLIDRCGYDFITSFHVDLNPLFMHNAFLKYTLAFNAFKNAVLATDARYAHYFMNSLSAYARQLTPYHQIVQEPVQDGISPHFALRVPHVVVSYMSFLGCAQEDG